MIDYHIIIKIKDSTSALSFFKDTILNQNNIKILNGFYKIKDKKELMFYANILKTNSYKSLSNTSNLVELISKLENNISIECKTFINHVDSYIIETNFEINKNKTLLNWIRDQIDE